MKLDIKKVFPNNPSKFEGFRIIRLIAFLYMSVMVARSCIHLFASDGGAQSIAGIDTSVEGGNNIIAIFQLFVQLKLTNSLLGLVLINIAATLPIAIFILVAFFRQIPSEMYEVASIDGAGPVRLYRSIALPLSKPSMGAVAIFLFVITWNDLLFPLLLITQQDKKTLPLAMLDFRGEYSISFSMIFTAVMVASIPMVIMYLMMQRTFVAGLTAGAVKG